MYDIHIRMCQDFPWNSIVCRCADLSKLELDDTMGMYPMLGLLNWRVSCLVSL